jgi:DGQHR domain-containing protein
MIPNAVVVAFNRDQQFLPGEAQSEASAWRATAGTLQLPVDRGLSDEAKPGFIVDGQQRLAAIRDSDLEAFPIFVIAFVARDIQEQTEQFILVNSTKPLPKGLIYELLPDTRVQLPTLLHRRRLPAFIAERLNHDPDSPLSGMIQTPTSPAGVIKDNSVLRFVENSLSDGVLYRYREDDAGPTARMLPVLKKFWGAVRDVFPDAWGLPPKKSRLMHGAGVVSLGFVMDAVADRHRDRNPVDRDTFAQDLQGIREACRWTEGYWDFGPGQQRKWNELQNTSRDVQLLSNYLLVRYRERVWERRAN